MAYLALPNCLVAAYFSSLLFTPLIPYSPVMTSSLDLGPLHLFLPLDLCIFFAGNILPLASTHNVSPANP